MKKNIKYLADLKEIGYRAEIASDPATINISDAASGLSYNLLTVHKVPGMDQEDLITDMLEHIELIMSGGKKTKTVLTVDISADVLKKFLSDRMPACDKSGNVESYAFIGMLNSLAIELSNKVSEYESK